MQRYYLNLNYPNDYIIDQEGTELPDLEAAKREARQAIRELAADSLRTRRAFSLVSVRICDDGGALLGEVSVPEAMNEVLTSFVVRPPNPDSHA